jgi:pyrimidine-specific ribonucleoside hydrolase
METGDPDDFLTLCWLLDHPRADLLGVTVHPGTKEQIALVQWALNAFEKPEIPIGAWNFAHDKQCVNAWHNRFPYQDLLAKQAPPAFGPELIAEALAMWPDATVVCGGPLRNIARALEITAVFIPRLVIQGGFAGANVVPDPEAELPEFRGKEGWRTWNLNAALPAGEAVLAAGPESVGVRIFTSKNVCHRTAFDWRNEIPKDARKGLRILKEHCNPGKKLHDFVAAAVALEPDAAAPLRSRICTFRQIRLSQVKGVWRSDPDDSSRTWISVGIDLAAFKAAVLE